MGSAKDIWTAFREGRFGQAPPPFLGYLFLLEDRDNVKTPVVNKEPYFQVDPEFRGDTHLKDTAALDGIEESPIASATSCSVTAWC